jgi:hypothetical protein
VTVVQDRPEAPWRVADEVRERHLAREQERDRSREPSRTRGSSSWTSRPPARSADRARRRRG